MIRARLLVADDKENMQKLLRDIFPQEIHMSFAADGARALAMLAVEDFDVLLCDVRMPGVDGLAVLEETKRTKPDVEVVLMTAYGSVADAVTAIKRGAYDYLTKPFDPDDALLTVERAIERKRLREQARDLQAAFAGAVRFEQLVGRSPSMERVFDLMRRAARSDATVLVQGESGTGKELVVRAIHRASRRADKRFVAINCGAIPENLIEAELFGYVKGTFTGATGTKRGLFEEAHGGSLFLDEVGELPLPLQVKLTRALQERAVRKIGDADEVPVDVRVFAATHVDLRAAVEHGRFREDLFWRLNILPIRVPPLRERREDVPLLASELLARVRGDRAVEGFTPEALSVLIAHSWPGNVRELENVIARAVAVSDGPRIGVESLPEEIVSAPRDRESTHHLAALSYRECIELARDRASREYLVALMREFSGNVTQAAVRAGVERESLHRLMRRFGIRSEDYKAGGEPPTQE